MADPRSEPDNPSSISSTLLERVRAERPEAWERLADLYGPVVYRWCRHAGVPKEDSADVVQEVFSAVACAIGSFRRDRPGDSFQAWLAGITRHKIADHFRDRRNHPQARGGTDAHEQFLQLADVPDPSKAGDPSGVDGFVHHRALELVRAEFENRTWEAFWRTTVDGVAPRMVADELGMSVLAVYKARSRVLRRLRQEMSDLLD